MVIVWFLYPPPPKFHTNTQNGHLWKEIPFLQTVIWDIHVNPNDKPSPLQFFVKKCLWLGPTTSMALMVSCVRLHPGFCEKHPKFLTRPFLKGQHFNIGFLRGGCSRGGGNWGTLRNHHPPLKNPIISIGNTVYTSSNSHWFLRGHSLRSLKLTNIPWKAMIGRWISSLGCPIFRGKLLVSGRVVFRGVFKQNQFAELLQKIRSSRKVLRKQIRCDFVFGSFFWMFYVIEHPGIISTSLLFILVGIVILVAMISCF